MKDLINTFQLIFTSIGGYMGWFLGGVDGFMYALITFVVIDYVTGLMVAVLEKSYQVKLDFEEFLKKYWFLFLLV